jgi:medium-chain acyl-[acyl-carrier-protein] hydrolase
MPMTSEWITYHEASLVRSLRLFCFPHAGGSALLFRKWQEFLPRDLEVCPVQLPGRGLRMREPLLESIEALVTAAAAGLRPFLDEPFALFGHSMGALIAFELARRLSDRFGLSPVMLLVAGAVPPHLRESEEPTWHLPDLEFMVKLREMNGTPAELLKNAELMELLMPIMRADFRAVQTYRCPRLDPIDCPIAAFGGLRDKDVTVEKLKGWQDCTRGSFSYSLFDGDHFFINGCQGQLLNRIAQQLAPIAGGLRQPMAPQFR